MVDRHVHNGVDSQKIDARDLINAPQNAITQVSGTAGGTYTATEQKLVNDLKTAVNDIITKLQTLHLTK